MSEQIQKLVSSSLQEIAKRNGDKFCYKIDIRPHVAGCVFQFVAEETADGHVFVAGTGNTIEDAVVNASAQIPVTLAEWGYD